jgi:hypothetical protein
MSYVHLLCCYRTCHSMEGIIKYLRLCRPVINCTQTGLQLTVLLDAGWAFFNVQPGTNADLFTNAKVNNKCSIYNVQLEPKPSLICSRLFQRPAQMAVQADVVRCVTSLWVVKAVIKIRPFKYFYEVLLC